MNNKSKQIFKILIPVLAVVIIVESVIVVSRLESKKAGTDVDLLPESSQEVESQDGQVYRQVDVKASFVFSVDNQEILMREKKRVTLELLPKENFELDALDLYVSYDAGSLVVSDLREEGSMVATSKKISDKTGIVLSNFWSMDETGYVFEEGKPVKLISFLVEARKVGNHELSVIETGDEMTKLVSSVDGEVVTVGFLSEKLVISTQQ